jgi:hypothetical protein
VAGKEVRPKCFWCVVEGSTQFKSPLRDEEVFLVEENVVGFVEDGVGGGVMVKDVTKLSMMGISFVVIPPIHRVGSVVHSV